MKLTSPSQVTRELENKMAAKNGKTQLSPKPKTQNTKTLHAENHIVCTERTAEEEEGALHTKLQPQDQRLKNAASPQNLRVHPLTFHFTVQTQRQRSVSMLETIRSWCTEAQRGQTPEPLNLMDRHILILFSIYGLCQN